MFNEKSAFGLASIIAVGIALSACTVVERDQRSSTPPTVVMQPAPPQPAAAVIVR